MLWVCQDTDKPLTCERTPPTDGTLCVAGDVNFPISNGCNYCAVSVNVSHNCECANTDRHWRCHDTRCATAADGGADASIRDAAADAGGE
jgi:hypothetical protein